MMMTYIDSPTPSQGQKIHSHLIKSGFRPNTNLSIKLLISTSNAVNSPTPAKCLTKFPTRPSPPNVSMALKLSSLLNSLNLAREVHTQFVKCGCESDDVLFTALVDSYVKNARVGYARLVFDEMPRSNVVCATAMITGYMNQGSVGDAEEIFNRTEEKDVVVFNGMIKGYSRTAETAMRALEVYDSMRGLGFSPTVSTFSSVIGACSVLAAFDFATQVHAQLVKFNALANVKPASALVNTYCKCRTIGEARALFDRMAERTSSLGPCAHAGWVCEGLEIFESMERDYALTPRMEHYACMVDALGWVGRLGEALRFIEGMPERAGLDAWGALFGAARVHGDVGMANLAAREVFEGGRGGRAGAYVVFFFFFDQHGFQMSYSWFKIWAGAYVALSNTLAEAGEWEGMREVREMMVERGVVKNSGQSWVGADEGLRGFGVGDQNR
ncbi:Pentatricopeptide repeat-containing protein [Acorus calamus]|uniref:Pentatricopeptide repeat-containing protein n=1 Tax=Acorus calamus TaxID=4465 RepID=A0AAV9DRE9_ACOCL|nr:Pentatricopeptide repeat-containing protein [Acorus calamus]